MIAPPGAESRENAKDQAAKNSWTKAEASLAFPVLRYARTNFPCLIVRPPLVAFMPEHTAGQRRASKCAKAFMFDPTPDGVAAALKQRADGFQANEDGAVI